VSAVKTPETTTSSKNGAFQNVGAGWMMAVAGGFVLAVA